MLSNIFGAFDMKAAYELVEAIQCRVCREIKLRKHFIRLPTHKQLEVWGYRAEHISDYEIESDTCHDCKPIPKKDLKSLRRNQLYELLRYGVISAVEYNAQMQERKELRRQRGSAARTEAWQQKWRPLWQELIKDLNTAARKATFQANHAKKTHPSDHGNNRFFALQKEVFACVRSALGLAAHRCESAPPSSNWLEYVHPMDVEALRILWNDVQGVRAVPALVDRVYQSDGFQPLYPVSQAQRRLERVKEMTKQVIVFGASVPDQKVRKAASELVASMRASALRVSNK
jgi:hypothetical protein